MRLNLNTGTKERLFELAEETGIKPKELAETVINDFVNAWYINNPYNYRRSIYSAVVYVMGSIKELIRILDERESYTQDLVLFQDGKHEEDRQICISAIAAIDVSINAIKKYYSRYNNGYFEKELADLVERYKKFMK